MSLDRSAIVDAALALVDREGLEGLSTRKLAAELGIRGPSLYWHFKNKRELVDHIAARLRGQALPPPSAGAAAGFDRRNWLEAGARGLRRVALAQRDGAAILAGARPPPVSEDGQRTYGAFLSVLEGTGLSPHDSALVLQVLGRFAIGWVLYEQSGGMASGVDSDVGFEFGLQALLDGIEKNLGAGRPLEAATTGAA
jgi:TetR/AcrR family tetracycline transcriptional repressor